MKHKSSVPNGISIILDIWEFKVWTEIRVVFSENRALFTFVDQKYNFGASKHLDNTKVVSRFAPGRWEMVFDDRQSW